MSKFVVVMLVVILSGCATAINRKTAERYHQAGLQAAYQGDYTLAEKNFSRALINARLGNLPISGLSMITYNLGRTKGYLCKHQEAEVLLLEALKLEKKVEDENSGLMAMRLFDLARLYYVQGNYNDATVYFGRAIPVVKKLGLEKSDPIALAIAMEKYSISLAKSGNMSKANDVKSESSLLREKNPGVNPKFVAVNYNENCS